MKFVENSRLLAQNRILHKQREFFKYRRPRMVDVVFLWTQFVSIDADSICVCGGGGRIADCVGAGCEGGAGAAVADMVVVALLF